MQSITKHIIIKVFIFALFSATILMCQKEVISKRDYPRLQTLKVTNITKSGAVFNAEIITGGDWEIIDHGFVWEESRALSLEFSEMVSLGPVQKIGKFSAKISTTIEKGILYYVKAYIKTSDRLIYAQEVAFIGSGSCGPVIERFEPQNGDIGDTITIIGNNYSRFIEKMVVEFGNHRSQITYLSGDTLNTIVPEYFDDTLSFISVSILGNSTTSENSFLLNPPKINSFEPVSGYQNDEITIIGKNFIPGYTDLYFDSTQIEIRSLKSTSLQCVIPSDFLPKYYYVSIKVFEREVIASESFLVLTAKEFVFNQ